MCKHIFTPIAHRGGTEVAFENTFEAFADAYALGSVSYTHLTLPTSDLV